MNLCINLLCFPRCLLINFNKFLLSIRIIFALQLSLDQFFCRINVKQVFVRYLGPTTWNDTPGSIRSIMTLQNFKRNYRSVFPRLQSYPTVVLNTFELIAIFLSHRGFLFPYCLPLSRMLPLP